MFPVAVEDEIVAVKVTGRPLFDGFASDVNGRIIKSAREAGGKGDIEITTAGMRYLSTMEQLFEDVKSRGAELLRGEI